MIELKMEKGCIYGNDKLGMEGWSKNFSEQALNKYLSNVVYIQFCFQNMKKIGLSYAFFFFFYTFMLCFGFILYFGQNMIHCDLSKFSLVLKCVVSQKLSNILVI